MKIDPKNLEWKEAHELLVSTVMPRPIAFVSTISEDGVLNVAPFSFFAAVATKPMLVGFTTGWKESGQKKDTLVNIEFSRDFVVNVVNEAIATAMNQASEGYPSHVDEFKEVGLTPAKSDIVKPPMIAESPISMECRVVQILEFGNPPRRASFIIGEVVRVHIKDELNVGDDMQVSEWKAIAHMGGELFCRATDVFEMK